MNTVKKQRKIMKWEGLEISSRNWRDPGNISRQRNKGQKMSRI